MSETAEVMHDIYMSRYRHTFKRRMVYSIRAVHAHKRGEVWQKWLFIGELFGGTRIQGFYYNGVFVE